MLSRCSFFIGIGKTVARIVSEQARRKTGMDANAKLDMCGNAQNHSGHSFIL
ncbi:hypothetical protein NTGZN8_280008 [Candidatus Nitrotoga fabula]|uniref:Uncharacterized protein n=1 Tax=Candidatus Nitrotoga fabula TaxID=2182327 RepID=A0A916FB15_9PROT|nr:hypothetical protein NTGZN8_280008 [Candidatus Nitrotoga fabula]